MRTFLRPPGYEYRNKIDSHAWRRAWDWALFISSVIPVFVFGVAFGNCFIGFPFHFNQEFRLIYTGNFWDLLNPYALLSGCVSVLMVLMHGSVYLQRRTTGKICSLAFKVHVISAILLLIGFTVSGMLLVHTITGYNLISSSISPTIDPLNNIVTKGPGLWIKTYDHYTWKYLAPVFAYGGIIESIWAAGFGWYKTAFWASCFAVGGIVSTAGATLFPFLMPSSTTPAHSLTVWNSASTQYSLNIMLYIGFILFIIILAYKIFAYQTIWGKTPTLSAEEIEKDESHTFY